jgi:hypothetical protein
MNSTNRILQRLQILFLLGNLLLVIACKPSASPQASAVPSSAATLAPSPTATTLPPSPTPKPTPASIGELIPKQTFEDGSSPFCQSKADLTRTGGLTFSCADGQFAFFTQPEAKDTYKFVQVSLPIQPTETFTLEADLFSQGAPGKADQNNYGFIFGVDETHTYSLRVKGQYYRFEKNLLMKDYLKPEGEIFLNKNWNWNYSSAFKPTGNQNHLQMTCAGGSCDLTINQQLAARFNLDQTLRISSLSLFAEVGYYKPFGRVSVDNLHLYAPADPVSPEKVFVFNDPLQSDQGTFSKTGMSGAYNRFQPDGFHFSPIVAFGYYGVKSDPALGDVSVSASVRLKADSPQTSMYAGLVCRSSLDGMYFAAIRESGYFSVFRDSPTRPFSLLAEARATSIKTGGEVNQLRLDCIGSNISFYVNGIKVASLQDNTFNLIFGRSGFFTKAGKNPDGDAIVFSNLEVKEVR